MTVYDTIGNHYNKTRSPDQRILSQILSLIHDPPPLLIADIGAGTGNYSFELADRGYQVHALEPSEKMLEQRKNHDRLTWYSGFAECDQYSGIHISRKNFDCLLSAAFGSSRRFFLFSLAGTGTIFGRSFH